MVRIPNMERIPIVDPILMKPDLHHGTGRISSSEWMLMNPEDLDNFSSDMMKSLLDEEEKEKSVRLEWPPVDPAKQTEAGEHTFSTAKKPSKKKGRRPLFLNPFEISAKKTTSSLQPACIVIVSARQQTSKAGLTTCLGGSQNT